MIKIKKNCAIIFLFLVILTLTLSSCVPKSECKSNSDCSSRTCFLSKCESRKCSYSLVRNCCGNKLKEELEDGKPGNQCTCPSDFGVCGGKAKIKYGSRTEDAVYVHSYCDNDKCAYGVEKKDITTQNILDPIVSSSFKASSIIKYNKPFDAGKDVFEFKIVLDDTREGIILPVELTKLRLFYSSPYSKAELLVAEQDLNKALNNIGDGLLISLPLNLGYKPNEVEETGSIKYTIDYNYVRQIPNGKLPDGTVLYKEETNRDRFTSSGKQVFFVRTG